MTLDLQQRPYDWREKAVRLEWKLERAHFAKEDLGTALDDGDDASAEQTWTPTHLDLWPKPGTTEPNRPTAGTHGATHEIDYVVWRYQGHQIDVYYLNDEPDHLFGSEVVVTAFAKDEGLNLVATPDGTRQWVRDPYTWHAA